MQQLGFEKILKVRLNPMSKDTSKKTPLYTHLTKSEREEIAIGVATGLSQYAIAKVLKRSPSSISRELLRNKPAKNIVGKQVIAGSVVKEALPSTSTPLKYPRTPIKDRPLAANLRTEPGHWEADTAVSRQSKAAIAIVIERTSRLVKIRHMLSKSAHHMEQALISSLADIPPQFRKSITYDNGTENTRHQTVNKALNTLSFFCEPYHSWEKGSVEQVIGLIRRTYPKKTDWALISQSDLDIIQHKLNHRPRKCLNFLSPHEAYVALAA